MFKHTAIALTLAVALTAGAAPSHADFWSDEAAQKAFIHEAQIPQGGPTPTDLEGQRLAQVAANAIMSGSSKNWQQVNVVSHGTNNFEVTLYYKAAPASRDEVAGDLRLISWRLSSVMRTPASPPVPTRLIYTIQAMRPVADPRVASGMYYLPSGTLIRDMTGQENVSFIGVGTF